MSSGFVPEDDLHTWHRKEAGHTTPFLLDRGPRAAWMVYLAMLVLAVPMYLWSGRNRWFFGDEWQYLVSVDAGDLEGLLRADNEHWTTLPKISYRMLFNVFGINTYLPYQLVTISLHLVAATLLRVVMRRSGVSPWMATLVAGVFVLFGSGDHNILRAFQVTFGAALVFGLVQLVLAEHEGPIDRRDVLGLLAGVAAFMCSGVGIAMVAAVAATMLVARGWRVAVFHLVPLMAVYAIWWWTFARGALGSNDADLPDVGSFAFAMVSATFEAVGQLPVGSLLIGALLVVGLALAWRNPSDPEVRRRNAAPVGLLFGAFVFISTTAWSRADLGTDFANQSRYVHIVAALLLPALAVGADAVARRWPLMAPVLIVLLLIGVPGNVSTTWNQTGPGRGDRGDRELILASAVVPAASRAPDWARPDPEAARPVTMGWLRDGIERGRVPQLRDIDPALAEAATFRIELQIVQQWVRRSCERLTQPTQRHIEPAESIGFVGPILVRKIDPVFSREIVVPFEGVVGSSLLAMDEPLDITIIPRDGTTQLCEKSAA
jgi:hypothetical protein